MTELEQLHQRIDGAISPEQRRFALAGGAFRAMLQVFATATREAAVAYHEAWELNKAGKRGKADEMIALAEAWDRRACQAREAVVTLYAQAWGED